MALRQSARAEIGTNEGGIAASVLAHLGIAEPPVLRCSSLQTPVTILRLQSEAAKREDYADLPQEDAWIFRLHLNELADHSLWLDGKRMPVAKCSPGSVSVYDVQLELAVSITDPLDVVRIFVPRAALDELAKEFCAPRVRRLDVAHGAATHDPAIYALISSVLPALMAPKAAFGLFVDRAAGRPRAYRSDVRSHGRGTRGIPRQTSAMAGAAGQGDLGGATELQLAACRGGGRVRPICQSLRPRIQAVHRSTAPSLAAAPQSRASKEIDA